VQAESNGPAKDPPAMSRGKAIAYAIGIPVALLALVFVPAGRIDWRLGWIFIAVLTVGYSISGLVLARVNPIIYRARSRFQPGTMAWDRKLLAIILPAMVLSIPLSAFDAGRMHWSSVPGWAIVLGYAANLVSIAITAWAQAVNPFFEPGVRLQTERKQHVIDSGPYRFVRHPGYVGALLAFAGVPLALGSWWGLVPAAAAGALLIVRTSWEDRLLRENLAGYADYARRVGFRLFPGLW
jgi:protein-S-isoprenylcysteine O-methyltransferase Ste14